MASTAIEHQFQYPLSILAVIGNVTMMEHQLKIRRSLLMKRVGLLAGDIDCLEAV